MSELDTIPNGEFSPVNANEETIFTIRYNKNDVLVINWNQFPDANELVEAEQPLLDAKSKKRLVGSFALRGVIFESAFVGFGGTDVVPGTALDLVGGAALLGLAGYTAKREEAKYRSKEVKRIEKKSNKRERNPERILRIPKVTLAYTVSNSENVDPDLSQFSDNNTIEDVELINQFAKRNKDPNLIRFVDPEAYAGAKEESEGLLQEKMEIYVKRSKKRRNKKFKPEDVTVDNYLYAQAHLRNWDFKNRDNKRIFAIDTRIEELNQITSLPALDDKPTFYIDIQKIVGICAQWLNDRATSPEVLADIYEISYYSKKVSNDEPEALNAISDAVHRLVEHSVYAT